jgi:superfamily II DNA/RNA helicase
VLLGQPGEHPPNFGEVETRNTTVDSADEQVRQRIPFRRSSLRLGQHLSHQPPAPQGQATGNPRIVRDRLPDRGDDERRVAGVSEDVEHECLGLGVEEPGHFAVEVDPDAVSHVGLHQTFEPVGRCGRFVEPVDRSHEGLHRLLGIGAQFGQPVAQPGEVPELGDGHSGELCLVADPRRQRGIGSKPDERGKLPVGEHSEQVDDGRTVGGIVRRSRHARTVVGTLTAQAAARAPRITPQLAAHRAQKAIVLTTFRDLGVLPQTCAALEAAGITEPFAIQELALPVALTGQDVIGQAKTGTGKTLAFGIPVLQRIIAPDDTEYEFVIEQGRPQALVVVPTRELCIQVAGDLRMAGARRGVRVAEIYGGRAYEPQIEGLRTGMDVVVGTPGRLIDLAQQRHLDLAHVKVLVLDEADEMLDLGFLPDVEKIVSRTPENRQTMLFSATMPGVIVNLARRYMRQPTHIRATQPGDEGATVTTVEQHVFRTHDLDKPELLARVLQAQDRGLTIVFCPTRRMCDRVAGDLTERGFAAGAVHGDLGQGAREQALRAFRSGKVDVLVATDVAARGIDVDGVTHVVNYTCPEDEKTYLHRIGRTARAGAAGVAVTLVDWADLTRWALINKALGLSFNELAETYSTSDWLYEALQIPRSATGKLPSAQQTRAGLAAETLEDVGETGHRVRSGTRPDRPRPGRGGSGHSGSPREGSSPRTAPARGSSAGSGSSRDDVQPARPPRSRSRRRTRSGEDVKSAPASPATPPADADPEPPTGARRSRPRRRRSGSNSSAAATMPTGSTTGSPTSAASAAASAKPAEPTD